MMFCNQFISRFASALLLATLTQTSYGCSQAPTDLDSILHAYEVADHEASLKDYLLRDFTLSEVVDAAMARLTTSQDEPLSSQGQNRMWRLLAILPGEDAGSFISDGDRVANLTDGLLLGTTETKLLIMQHAHRISGPLRAKFGSAVLQQIPIETNVYALLSMIDTTTIYHNLAGQSKTYVESLVVNLLNANTNLAQSLQPTMVERYGTVERSLRITCLASLIANASDVNDALNIVLATPDDDSEVLDAMYAADNIGSVLEGAPVDARVGWVKEYGRRFCLDSATFHSQRYSVWYIHQLFDRYDDMDGTLCSVSQNIETQCDTDQLLGYEGLIRLVSERCE